MFLWWSKKKDDPDAAIEVEKHEIEELKHELTTATLARPSPVSKAKFNKWVVAEDNRTVGDNMRGEMEALMSQREENRTEFLDSGHERTQAAKHQREVAAERVRQHRANMAQRGRTGKSDKDTHVSTARTLKDQYQQYGARNAQIHGAEQRERLTETRAERDESRRMSVQSQKQAMLDRAEAFQEATQRQIEEKRQRVARIRDETKPEVAEASKQLFANSRKQVADDVRESVKEWNTETNSNHMTALMQARLNRYSAEETRKKVLDGRKALEEQRRKDAGAIRTSIKQCELHRDHMKYSTEFAKRERHDEAFESTFVAPEQAITVERSSYEMVANTHREELNDGPRSPVPRGNWLQHFTNTEGSGFLHSSGFFNGKGWFW